MYHSLSIHLLNHILVASKFWQLWTKLLQTCVCRLLCGHKTSVHLGKYHEAQLQNCLVRLYLVFKKNLQTIFQSGCTILYSCCCLVVNSCLTLCDPIDCSPPGPSVHEISHARILECIAISFSRVSSWPRNRTHVSNQQVDSLPLSHQWSLFCILTQSAWKLLLHQILASILCCQCFGF